MDTSAKQYVEKYYGEYISGEVDQEMHETGHFLIKNAKGKVLDCGCGPVPQIWAVFMPYMDELCAIDLPQESIDFVKNKLAHVEDWLNDFGKYKIEVEKSLEHLPEDYISKQIAKIKSVLQSDVTIDLPFASNYFDTVISLYSLGCLKSEDELQKAIINLKQVLKPGGILLHINTNGQNKNDDLPAYTWNGISQASTLIKKYLIKEGFIDISVQEVSLDQRNGGMYKFDAISLLRATKGD